MMAQYMIIITYSILIHRTDMFSASAGARSDAKRILIVITDGESSDSSEYSTVTKLAEGKSITRYAVGV